MMQKRKRVSPEFFLQKPILRLGLCALLFFACLFLGWCLPLEAYGERTGLALGFALGIIALWISNLLPILVPALLLAIGGRLLGFFNDGSLLQTLGNPILYVMFGFSIIAMGAESTNFARRFSFLVLKRFGKRPGRILFSFLLATVVLSTFISNIATTLLVGGLAAQLLAVMEEKSGQSVFGSLLTPYFSHLSPLEIMILSALLMTLLNNLFVNASSGILSLLVVCETPVLLSAGLNPAVILLPTLFLASFTLAFGTHVNVFVLYGYGYWNMRDPIVPGFLFCVFCAFLFSLLVYLIALAGGLPMYLTASVPAI